MNYVLESEFLKKKVEILPLNSLACFMYKYLQVCQLSQEHLSFLQNLLNFIITKYLKQEVDDDLIVCVDEGSPCCLAITGDKDKALYKDLSRVTCNYATSSTGVMA